jgi:hypothetical protein
MTRPVTLVALALLLGMATACGNSTTSPAETPETFSGTLAPSSQSVQTFNTATSGTVTATATSLNPLVTVQLGIGNLSGSACAATAQASVQQGGVVSSPVSSSGTYCFVVTDVTGLPSPVAYTITVDHP